jgi:hypothetical protein
MSVKSVQDFNKSALLYFSPWQTHRVNSGAAFDEMKVLPKLRSLRIKSRAKQQEKGRTGVSLRAHLIDALQ